MAPNGKCGRHPKAKSPRVSRGEVIKESAPCIHEFCQPHTHRNHPAPIQWSFYHLTHGNIGYWAEDETRMVSLIPNDGSIQPIWGPSGVCRKCWHPNPRSESSQHILPRTGGMKKACKQWERLNVGLKIWQVFKDNFLQTYRWYQIRKKEIAAVHGYAVSENHSQWKESVVMTVDTLKALASAAM